MMKVGRLNNARSNNDDSHEKNDNTYLLITYYV
jgi:hypothetical protein